MYLKKLFSILWVSVPVNRAAKETVMKYKEVVGNTFNRDTSCAACHPKLVSCHTGVEAYIRFGCIPYPKAAVVQNGDPVVTKLNDLLYCIFLLIMNAYAMHTNTYMVYGMKLM